MLAGSGDEYSNVAAVPYMMEREVEDGAKR